MNGRKEKFLSLCQHKKPHFCCQPTIISPLWSFLARWRFCLITEHHNWIARSAPEGIESFRIINCKSHSSSLALYNFSLPSDSDLIRKCKGKYGNCSCKMQIASEAGEGWKSFLCRLEDLSHRIFSLDVCNWTKSRQKIANFASFLKPDIQFFNLSQDSNIRYSSRVARFHCECEQKEKLWSC
jgi:hypothetical protein